MSKNLFFKFCGALVILSATIFWVLSLTMPEQFGEFNLAWAGLLLCGGLGILFVVQGLMQKNISTIKKLNIWFGVALIVCAFLCLVSALVIPKSLVIPIICVIVAAGLLITILATGGVKWDEGDNHKVGYKNYHQRKKEEEKEKNKQK